MVTQRVGLSIPVGMPLISGPSFEDACADVCTHCGWATHVQRGALRQFFDPISMRTVQSSGLGGVRQGWVHLCRRLCLLKVTNLG